MAIKRSVSVECESGVKIVLAYDDNEAVPLQISLKRDVMRSGQEVQVGETDVFLTQADRQELIQALGEFGRLEPLPKSMRALELTHDN